MRGDLKILKDSVNIVDIIGRYVELKKMGSEYKGMCPFHDDTKPSLNVNESKQLWFCPACDGNKKGDVFDFLTAMGNSLPQAIQIIQGDMESAIPEKVAARTKRAKPVTWKHVRPQAECKDFTHYMHGQPNAIYTYKDINGLVGYVCRFDLEDRKETLPYIYATDGIRYQWKYQGFTDRPLYNADIVEKYPQLPVIVVEGEKVADWVNERMDGKAIAVTWVGGSNQVEKTNFDILNGRKLLFCRDNDEPGLKCMTYVHDIVKSDKKKWGIIPPGSPKAWDLADSKLTKHKTQEYVRRNMRDPIIKKHDQDEKHFTYLGFEKSDNQPVFIFYCKQSKTIFKLTAASMTKSTIMCMAPLDWWERKFDGLSAKGLCSAQNVMINTSYKVGIYSPKNVRGRGAWYDESRVVIHAGDKLIVDGEIVQLGALDTNYIYEIGESFNFNTENPLTAARASNLLRITNLLNWERGVNAQLLAGWCVIAPVCGALRWRPHVWLTGGAGSGKSYTLTYIMRPLLGDTCLDVQGSTTEAGLRQSLCFDAMPVVFDEIEGNDTKSIQRVQETLELARSASADDTGRIIKGSSSHSAKEFQIRSCFAFSSISIGVDKGSDRRRITTLSLVQPADKEYREARYKELETLRGETITEDFITGLHARTIKLLPVILENAKTFNMATVKVLGAQSMGDQLGPMLAGCYSLQKDGLITYDEAVKFVEAQDWREERENESVKDEVELFLLLMQWKLKVEAYGEHTVGKLVSFVAGLDRNDGFLTESAAAACLLNSGIRVLDNNVVFSGMSHEIRTRLKDTRWSKNYSKILMRLEGSVSCSVRFSGMVERSVKIPVSILADKVSVKKK